MNPFKYALEQLAELEAANYAALQELMGIRPEAITAPEEILVHYNSTMNKIRMMILHYVELDTTIDTVGDIFDRFDAVEDRSLDVVERLYAAYRLGQGNEQLRETALRDLFERVETLSDNLQNPRNDGFYLENVVTPHDLIRYLHQKSVDTLFDFNNLNFGDVLKKVQLGISSMKVLDLEDVLHLPNDEHSGEKPTTTSLPLSSIIRYASNEISRTARSSQEISIIASKERVTCRFSLGCHYGELEGIFPEEGLCTVKIMFQDTVKYDSSKERTAYVRQVLKQLGFSREDVPFIIGKNGRAGTENGPNLTYAVYKGKPREAEHTLRETLRLLASTQDLDCCPILIKNGMTEKTVKAFFAGYVNLKGLIGNYYDDSDWPPKKPADHIGDIAPLDEATIQQIIHGGERTILTTPRSIPVPTITISPVEQSKEESSPKEKPIYSTPEKPIYTTPTPMSTPTPSPEMMKKYYSSEELQEKINDIHIDTSDIITKCNKVMQLWQQASTAEESTQL